MFDGVVVVVAVGAAWLAFGELESPPTDQPTTTHNQAKDLNKE